METILILAAAAVAVLALACAGVLSARARRPPLRTRQEEEMLAGDPAGLVAAISPAGPSPIDRDSPVLAPILEVAAIEAALADRRVIASPSEAGRAIGGQRAAPPGAGARTGGARGETR